MSKRNTKRSRKGLGDAVESITKATGIKAVVEFFNDGKPCESCEKRKEKLNKIFERRLKVHRTFSENEYNWYKEFKENRTLKFDHDTILKLCKLYSEIFKLPYWKPTCFTCQGTLQSISNIIDKLDKIYNSYE